VFPLGVTYILHQLFLLVNTIEKIILYPDNRVEVILKFNIPTDPNGSNGKKSREYNVGAEGGNLTYTHGFRLA
jgi:hypothetical protein